MTLEEMRNSTAVCVTVADAAGILCVAPQLIREVARDNPAQLGFPVVVLKSRVLIPRIPFLRFIGEEDTFGKTGRSVEAV